jgi:hypothetical protein
MIEYRPTANNKAMVAPDLKWLPIDKDTPLGIKMMLIDKGQGVAYMRVHLRNDGFTHWHPLPTF